MERIRFIEHRGHRILYQDFSDITDPTLALATIEQAIEFVERLPADGSLLILTNAHGSRYNTEVLDALKGLAKHNQPWVRASAVVTGSALHRVAVTAVRLFTGRTIEVFGDVEEAKDWLVEQSA